MPTPSAPHGSSTRRALDFGDLPNVYVAPTARPMAELFTTKVSVNGAGGRPA